MVSYLSPGVFVEEVSVRQQSIQGIATSVAAFIGLNNNSAVQGAPRQIASYQEFTSMYGQCSDPQFEGEKERVNYLGYAVQSFFINGGRKCYIAPIKSMTVTDYDAALKSLQNIPDISLVTAPGYSALPEAQASQITQRLIDHCEKMRYRFALLDAPLNADTQQLLAVRQTINSHQAAIYAPWLRVYDAALDDDILIPPCGTVAGVLARVDMNYGVWKAPSNDALRGISGFERDIDHNEQSILLPRGINLLRNITARGQRIWGVRTTSDNTMWRYVPVRRTALYIEHSIKQGLKWAVFEPNETPLWASVLSEVGAFLDRLWRRGAFQGSKTADAYFVRVDRGTMTQKDIIEGKLYIEIGFAAMKPAEFAILRICIVTRPGHPQ